jgi:cell division protease FtsH
VAKPRDDAHIARWTEAGIGMPNLERKTQVNLWYVVIAVFAILALQHFWLQSQTIEQISYSEFQRDLEQGNIKDVGGGDKFIRGSYAKPHNGKTQFVTARVEPGLAERPAKSNVEYTGAVENTFVRDLLSWIVPVLFFFGLWFFVIRRFADKQALAASCRSARARPRSTWRPTPK